MNTIAVVLAGGSGTRFWPASRNLRPKQLLPLAGGVPLIRATAERVLPLVGGWSGVWVATGAHLADATLAVLPELDRGALLVEPVARNTAPAIGWAAARAARTDPDAVLMVLPSDPHIADTDGFRRVAERALASARSGVITTIGIRPTYPATGYGYVEVDGRTGDDAVPVRRFVEKPDAARAAEFVASGRFLWNAGMFFFRAKDMLAAVAAHQPALAAALSRLDEAAAQGREADAVAGLFPTMPSVSIDHGVMEHVADLAVVPGDFGWSDVGSWQSAWELADKDASGNHAPDGAVLVDARGNHVVDLRTPGAARRVVALVGVADLVVVETDDALLVVPRERSQDVKLVVDALRARGETDRI